MQAAAAAAGVVVVVVVVRPNGFFDLHRTKQGSYMQSTDSERAMAP